MLQKEREQNPTKRTQIPFNSHEWRVVRQRLHPGIFFPDRVIDVFRRIKSRVLYEKPAKLSKRI